MRKIRPFIIKIFPIIFAGLGVILAAYIYNYLTKYLNTLVKNNLFINLYSISFIISFKNLPGFLPNNSQTSIGSIFIVETCHSNSMLLSSSHRSLFVLREVFSALTSLYTFIIYNKNKKKRQVVKLALKLVKLVISSISFAFFL